MSQLIGEDPLPNEHAQSATESERGWNRVPLIFWKDAAKWPEIFQQYNNSTNVAYVSTDAPV